MREILFRGKARSDFGERWIYGDYVHFARGHQIWAREIGGGNYLVDPATVGQYTGLTDKRGKQIFEGDIVRDDKGNVGHVEFLIQAAGYVIVWKHCDTSLGHRARGGGYDRDPSLEVIGNIHDNPELLEEDTEK